MIAQRLPLADREERVNLSLYLINAIASSDPLSGASADRTSKVPITHRFYIIRRLLNKVSLRSVCFGSQGSEPCCVGAMNQGRFAVCYLPHLPLVRRSTAVVRTRCVSFGGFVSCLLFLFPLVRFLVWLLVRFLLRLCVLLLSCLRCVPWRLLLVLLGSVCVLLRALFLGGALLCTFLPVLLLLVLLLLFLLFFLVLVSPLVSLLWWCAVVVSGGAFLSLCRCFSLLCLFLVALVSLLLLASFSWRFVRLFFYLTDRVHIKKVSA